MIEPRRLAPLMAALGGLLLLYRLVDLRGTPGLDFATAPGRARLIAAILSRSAVPLVADLLLIAAVVLSGRAGLQRALGAVHVVAGILLLLSLPIFWFASARLAETINPREFTSFKLLVIRGLILLGGFGVGGFATGRILLGMGRLQQPVADGPAVDLPKYHRYS